LTRSGQHDAPRIIRQWTNSATAPIVLRGGTAARDGIARGGGLGYDEQALSGLDGDA
jgi:hypothetical protein